MRGFSFPSCSESGGLLFDAPAGSGGGLEKSTVQASGESSPPAGLPAAAPRRVHGSSPLIHGSGQRRVEPARGAAASSCTSTSPWIKPRCGSSPAQRRRLEESARFEPAAAASLLWLEPAVVQARPRCCQRRRLETSTVQAGVALPAVRPPAAAARNLHCSSPPAVRRLVAAARNVHGSSPLRFKLARSAAASGGGSKKSTVRLRKKQSRTLVPWIQRVEGWGSSPTSGKVVTCSCALNTESGGRGIEYREGHKGREQKQKFSPGHVGQEEKTARKHYILES